jgi:hypothetical protein
MWYSLLLSERGTSCNKPIPIYQDDKSTIIMAIQGGQFKRTKYIIGRQSYVQERIREGDIALKYMPTKDIVADLLTEPVTKAVLDLLKQKLFSGPVDIKSKP